MSSMTFLINDTSTGGNLPVVQVTVTENPDGTLSFCLTQLASAGCYLGDLRGLFFDVNESLLNNLQVTSSAGYDAAGHLIVGGGMTDAQGLGTDNATTGDSVTNLGDGSNMEGLLNADGTKVVKLAGAEGNGYDVGIEIGTSGIGSNDIRTFEFTLDTLNGVPLSLASFVGSDFGVRITSVGQDVNGDGVIDLSRTGSVKIAEDIGVLGSGIAVSNLAVAENAVGAVVGTLSITGPDGSGATAYAVSDARFEVVGSQLMLKEGQSLNYETEQSVSLAVSANGSGWSSTQTFSINVTDVNEAPLAGADQTVGAAEDVSDATVLATVVGSDPDVGGGNDALNNFENLSYVIQSDASGKFEIDVATGAISLKLGESLDYEAAQSHEVTVRVSDGPGLYDDVAVTINVTDVEENVDPVATGESIVISDNITAINKAWVLGNDTDADGGSLSFASLPPGLSVNGVTGELQIDVVQLTGGSTYSPAGTRPFTVYDLSYTVSDGQGGESAQVTLKLAVVDTTSQGDTVDLGIVATYLGGSYSYSKVDTQNGIDSLTGTAAQDTFIGGAGNDTIRGSAGADTLTGDAGNDTFVFNSTLGGGNIDTITDFRADENSANQDWIELSATVFHNIANSGGTMASGDYAQINTGGTGDLTAQSVGSSVNIVFDNSTGALYYDANGGSLSDATQFAMLQFSNSTASGFGFGDIKVGT